MKVLLKKHIPFLVRLLRLAKKEFKKLNQKQKTEWGFYLSGNKKMAKGNFEVYETKLIRDLLGKVDLFINIGANIGYYCCHALDKNVKVMAFEPMENNLYYLYKNIEDNNWDDIEVYPIALTDRTGIIRIYGDNTGASLIPGWSNFESSYNQRLSVFKLDSLINYDNLEKEKLILIDIEGAEFSMLNGAIKLLKSEPSPIIIIEITYYGFVGKHKKLINKNYYKTFELFFNLGYKGYEINKSLIPIKTNKFQKLKHNNAFFESYNFMFKK